PQDFPEPPGGCRVSRQCSVAGSRCPGRGRAVRTMKVTIPIYVEGVGAGDRPGRRYSVRPLFFPHPRREHEKLDRAMNLLADDLPARARPPLAAALRRPLPQRGTPPRHDELAAWTFCPEVAYRRLDLVLELRTQRARCRLLLVTFPALDRTVAFSPRLPEVWF